MDNLLIIGAGQFGQVTKEIAESTGKYNKIDFLDDSCSYAVGKISDYKKLNNEYKFFVVAIGNAEIRKKIIEKLESYYILESIISKDAYISKSAKISAGCIVEPFAMINANTIIGSSCLICTHSVINHNAEIGDFCHINCGAMIKSNSKVDSFSKIDYGKIV